MVTTENYEEYLMMQADGELGAQELRALQAFLDAHPELAAEAGMWQELKLVPDASIQYAQQDTLLKAERKTVAFRPWHLAVPAAAALLLAVFLLQSPEPAQKLPVAQVTAPLNSTQENRIADPSNETAAVPVTNPPVPFRNRPRPRRVMLAMNTTPRAQRNTASSTRNTDALSRLTAQDASPIRVTPAVVAEPELLAMADRPDVVTAAPVQEHDRQVRVQLAAANVEAINAIRDGIDQRIEQLGRVAKTVRETSVVVKFGGNAFHINL